MAKILVVDDEIGIRELLSDILYDEGHTVEVAHNAATARTARQNSTFDLVLLDIWMPDTDGVSLLKEWASGGLLTMPVIMMSGHATIDTAVEATRIGALDFLEKPITMQKLLRSVENGLTRGKGPVRAGPSLQSLAASTIAAQNNRGSLDPAFTVVTNSALTSANPVAPAPAFGISAAPAPTTMGGLSSTTYLNTEAPASNDPPGRNGTVSVAELPLTAPLREARDVFERIYFEFHLAREGGSMTRVAEKTGLERTHLYRKLKQLGIELGKRRQSEM